MLYATGLVAGGSLAGIAIALLIGFGGGLAKVLNIGERFLGDFYAKLGLGSDIIALVMFGLLCLLVMRNARAKTV